MYTVVMGIKRMVEVTDAEPQWHLVMAVDHARDAAAGRWWSLLMQRWFVKGLIETEK